MVYNCFMSYKADVVSSSPENLTQAYPPDKMTSNGWLKTAILEDI